MATNLAIDPDLLDRGQFEWDDGFDYKAERPVHDLAGRHSVWSLALRRDSTAREPQVEALRNSPC